MANAGEAFGKGRSLEFGMLVKCKRISMRGLSAELQTGFNESFGPFVVCWLLVCFLRPMWVVQ